MLYWKAFLVSYPLRQRADACAYKILQELIDYNAALKNRYGSGTVVPLDGCPTYVCGNVQEKYCAIYSSGKYTIGNKCLDNTTCTLYNTANYAENGFSKISCANSDQTALTANEEEYFYYTICAARPEIRGNTDARLKTGTHPKECADDR